MVFTVALFLTLVLVPVAAFVRKKTWRKDLKEWRGFFAVYTLIVMMIMVGIVAENPARYFGPDSRSSCDEYKTAKPEYQFSFIQKCGCLSLEQAYAISGNSSVGAAVLACFTDKMRQCKRDEKIGRIYRACAEHVTGIKGEK